ncbi:MAG: helix-hairpin-helix domain-containing protein [Clostridiales bacterium]|nr:helix-hairpin-helix domain-containing protein [Clostridiales bacterium]
MSRGRFSVTAYLQETFRDRRRRKPFLVGLIVFIVVFVGLTAYQCSMEEKQGDVIIKSGEGGASQESPGAGGEAEGSEDPDAGGIPDGEGQGSAGGAADGQGSAGGDVIGQSTAATAPAAIFVDVGGAVRISGLFALPHGSRVADAIEAAGGLTEDADVKYLNRAAILSDGDRLYIPTAAEVRDGTAPPSAGQVTASGGYGGGAAAGSPASEGQGAAGTGAAQSLININTAGSEELQKLSGVGPATAQKIIDYRTRTGGFGRIEEIMNVSGIGAKTFEKLKAYITV